MFTTKFIVTDGLLPWEVPESGDRQGVVSPLTNEIIHEITPEVQSKIGEPSSHQLVETST